MLASERPPEGHIQLRIQFLNPVHLEAQRETFWDNAFQGQGRLSGNILLCLYPSCSLKILQLLRREGPLFTPLAAFRASAGSLRHLVTLGP